MTKPLENKGVRVRRSVSPPPNKAALAITYFRQIRADIADGISLLAQTIEPRTTPGQFGALADVVADVQGNADCLAREWQAVAEKLRKMGLSETPGK